MTKKDYIALSGALRKARPLLPHANRANRPAYEAWENCVLRVADACAVSPRFDRPRFLDACGVTA